MMEKSRLMNPIIQREYLGYRGIGRFPRTNKAVALHKRSVDTIELTLGKLCEAC
jgi:hypothetical protein